MDLDKIISKNDVRLREKKWKNVHFNHYRLKPIVHKYLNYRNKNVYFNIDDVIAAEQDPKFDLLTEKSKVISAKRAFTKDLKMYYCKKAFPEKKLTHLDGNIVDRNTWDKINIPDKLIKVIGKLSDKLYNNKITLQEAEEKLDRVAVMVKASS